MFLWISEALHMDIFHQPLRVWLYESLIIIPYSKFDVGRSMFNVPLTCHSHPRGAAGPAGRAGRLACPALYVCRLPGPAVGTGRVLSCAAAACCVLTYGALRLPHGLGQFHIQLIYFWRFVGPLFALIVCIHKLTPLSYEICESSSSSTSQKEGSFLKWRM